MDNSSNNLCTADEFKHFLLGVLLETTSTSKNNDSSTRKTKLRKVISIYILLLNYLKFWHNRNKVEACGIKKYNENLI